MRARAPIAAALAANALPAAAPIFEPVARALRIARTIPPGGVALTFDDGPHHEGTPAVLEALARESVPATFFLAGEQVERAPSLAAEISAAGHEVALHCHRHRNQLRLLPGQIADDTRRGDAAIVAATGHPPRLHRPPCQAPLPPAALVALGARLARRCHALLNRRRGDPRARARRRDPPPRRRPLLGPGVLARDRGGAAADHRCDPKAGAGAGGGSKQLKG